MMLQYNYGPTVPFSLKWPSFLWCSITAFMSPGGKRDCKQSSRNDGVSPSKAANWKDRSSEKNYCCVKNENFLARWAIFILQEVIIWLCYFAILPQLGTEMGGRKKQSTGTLCCTCALLPLLYICLWVSGTDRWGPPLSLWATVSWKKSNSVFNMDRTISCRCSFPAFGLFWWWDKRQGQNR